MDSNLPYVWFFLLAGVLVLFTVLAGADLGVGILSLLEKEPRRTQTLDTIGPQWYANETWLVIAGAIGFGAFPHVFGLVLSSLYVPAMLLIFGLMVRAVSAELRPNTSNQRFWNLVFGASCVVAAIGCGLLDVGVLTNPDAVTLPATGTWNWLNPFSVMMTIGVVAVFVSLGAARLIGSTKTSITPGIWRFWRYGIGLAAAIFVILLILLLAVSSPYNQVWPDGYRIILVPFFAAIALFCPIVALLISRKQIRGKGQYALSVASLAGLAGVVLAIIYPFVVPFSHTITEASSPKNTQVRMIFGVGIVLPIIVFYNIYIARVLSKPERTDPMDE